MTLCDDHPVSDDAEVDARIDELVDGLLAVGCDIWAVGQGYCINEPEDDAAGAAVRTLLGRFGPRHHLVGRFNAVLRRRGRLIEV